MRQAVLISIGHVTRYAYSTPALYSIHTLRLTPVGGQGALGAEEQEVLRQTLGDLRLAALENSKLRQQPRRDQRFG